MYTNFEKILQTLSTWVDHDKKMLSRTQMQINSSHTYLPNFDVAKLVFSPPPDTPNHEEHVDLTTCLSLEKFLSFKCFDSRYVVFWG